MSFKKVQLKPGVLKNVHSGHPWIYSGAIADADPSIQDGDLCDLYCKNQFLARGYYNSRTDIAYRILTRLDQPVDTDFFIGRLQDLDREKSVYLNNSNAYRLVFGESDHLPGLVIDRYDRAFVIQIHTMGMEKLKNQIVNAIISLYKPDFIYEKSDIGVRTLEGLEKQCEKPLYGKPSKEVIITEHGFQFSVNIPEGQKTGFFLDQRENRQALLKYSAGKRLLNCFCYTGGFSVYAASNAEKVVSIDISKPAIETVRRNFQLNGYPLEKHEFLALDVFDYLKEIRQNEYDLIILDPPSFAKNRKQLANAIKAYITINSKALEKLPDYGILISSSCTTHVDELTFIKILHQSSVNTRCTLKVLESKAQPPDHPYNLSFPEGRYLKYFVLQKIPLL